MFKILKFIIKQAIWFAVIAALLVIAVNAYEIALGRKASRNVSELGTNEADAILILGAGVYADNSPTPVLKDRLDRGIELYNAGAAPKILVSGDNVSSTETTAMRDYCLAQGVPAQDIFMDRLGLSTQDSLARASAIYGVRKILIVTQEYHIGRAVYLAGCYDMEALAVPAQDASYSNTSEQERREFLARALDFVRGRMRAEMTLLGGEYPISGDGRSSWQATVVG